MGVFKSRVLRKIFGLDSIRWELTARGWIVGSCMVCILHVTKSGIMYGSGDFWQVRREMCVEGFLVKPEGKRRLG
jgi:hypothetical protein